MNHAANARVNVITACLPIATIPVKIKHAAQINCPKVLIVVIRSIVKSVVRSATTTMAAAKPAAAIQARPAVMGLMWGPVTTGETSIVVMMAGAIPAR